MLEQIIKISDFIAAAFLHIWPYLLITIPISVAVNLSGAAKHINKAFKSRPFISIILATAVGAFSPFCSCGVIPIVASLLLGGVPLAPVMSFWIASPSMDPEMFFLSAATLGWELAVWRLASTFLLSLSAGFITHYLWKKGWLGDTFIKIGSPTKTGTLRNLIRSGFARAKNYIADSNSERNTIIFSDKAVYETASAYNAYNSNCGCGSRTIVTYGKLGCCDDPVIKKETALEISTPCGCNEDKPFIYKLLKETRIATIMVCKFMLLAFFLEALIILYVPNSLVISTMGSGNPFSILWAALIGVPVYTSNLSALPMIGGLLQQGMNPGAALAFLISGPITTIPAMAAVSGLTTRRVFYLYVSFAFFGALLFGFLFYFSKMVI